MVHELSVGRCLLPAQTSALNLFWTGTLSYPRYSEAPPFDSGTNAKPTPAASNE